MSHNLAQCWIANDAVLPLLDGLDEVTPGARDACVEAINVFRAVRGNLPIVVCSRIDDYEELTVTLRLHAAIVVQPLSREQVRQYVRDINFPFKPSSSWSPAFPLSTSGHQGKHITTIVGEMGNPQL